jgi:hypothetical protein
MQDVTLHKKVVKQIKMDSFFKESTDNEKTN